MKTPTWLKPALRTLLAVGMIGVGVDHFTHPGPFVHIVPAYLPAPEALVAISGFFEVLGGVGLLVPRVRRAAAWGLVALYVAVFPANINMAVNHISLDEAHPIPMGLLLARLPIQLVLIALAYWFTRPDAPVRSEAA
jgi:uncharacterized membrane protein